MPKYFLITQRPLQVKVVFEAENDKEARRLAQAHVDVDARIPGATVAYEETQDDIVFVELGRGEAYTNEKDILLRKNDYKDGTPEIK